jgi:hypothetical protein
MKKSIIFSIIFALVLGCGLFTASIVFADGGLGEISRLSGLQRGTSVAGVMGSVLGAALSLVGVIFFGLMIFGGIMWMTARGNAQQTDKALNTIISAIIGLILILSAYIIVDFVFKAGSGEGEEGTVSVSCREIIPILGSSCAGNEGVEGDIDVCDGFRCSTFGVCQAQFDSTCPLQCGPEFSCMDSGLCETGTIARFHCPGPNSRVCCIPRE